MFKNYNNRTKIKSLIILTALLIITSAFKLSEVVLIDTLDKHHSEGKGGSNPVFTIDQSYTITYAAVFFGARVNNPSPVARIWLYNENGKKTSLGSVESVTGQYVADAVYANSPNVTIPAGTYTVYTDDNTTWKINKSGYYQVLLKGTKN